MVWLLVARESDSGGKMMSSPSSFRRDANIEVSFVFPCLNESITLRGCIEAAMRCIETNGLGGEVVIADNGSTDGSQEIAAAAGARVVDVREKGYGSALRGGIASAKGAFIVMGDSDQSYDFSAAMPFIQRLRGGDDLVMGTRFGLGRIMPGAMPLKHQYLGNPVLSWLGRALFGAPIRDFHCGLRAFKKEAFDSWNLRTTGMEFASEMVIKATIRGSKISEVPIVLYKDGRDRPPHLRSWRDGWRHLRFMLTLSPRWTLFVPGLTLFALGATLMLLLSRGPIGFLGVTLDVHTLVAATMFTIIGYQCITVSIAMRIFALEEELGPPAPHITRLFRVFNLELGVLGGLLLLLIGGGLIAAMTLRWAQVSFGPLDGRAGIRTMLIGATLVALGMQTVLMSFVYSMLGIKRRPDK